MLNVRTPSKRAHMEMDTRYYQQFENYISDLVSKRLPVQAEFREIVNSAQARITEEAKAAIVPVATEHDRAISASSARLQGASRTVWLWFGAGGSILLLVLLVCWAVLGYYRRELVAAQETLDRYEDAIPVVQAYVASDAVLCGERICVNVDPNGQRTGDQRQYRKAKPRPPR